MPKISKNKLTSETYNSILKNLNSGLANLSNEKDVANLLDNLFTQTERLMLAKRLAIALLLDRGLSYKEIGKTIKVSSVTIGFVKNSIMKNNEIYNQLIQSLNKLKI